MKKILHPAMDKIRGWSGSGHLGSLRIDTIYELLDLPRGEEDDPAQTHSPHSPHSDDGMKKE
jgi:hypothetical protein